MMKMALAAKTPVLLPRRGESPKLSVLVNSIADPVHPRVIPNGIVCRINKDYFKVFVCGILIDPVGVENPQATKLSASSLLCD